MKLQNRICKKNCRIVFAKKKKKKKKKKQSKNLTAKDIRKVHVNLINDLHILQPISCY